MGKAVAFHINLHINIMRRECGYRELEIIDNLRSIEILEDAGRTLLKLHAIVDGEHKACIYDATNRQFVG